jgi:hypothetical protein
MQLQEETAGVAQDSACFVASPQRCGARGAVLADRLFMAGQQVFKYVLLVGVHAANVPPSSQALG